MTIIDYPHGGTKPKIVIGYDNQIKLMIAPSDDEKWTEEDFKNLEECKILYLEEKLGYKIERVESIITHDDYEKILEENTTFYRNTSH